MKAHIIASIIAILLSLPIIYVGADCWNHPGMYEDVIGDTIFGGILSFPLGYCSLRFYSHHYGFLSMADNAWAIPLWSAILIIQWVIWVNAFVAVGRWAVGRPRRNGRC